MTLIIALVMLLALDIRTFPPSVLGKATTFLEICTVTAILVVNTGWLPEIVPQVLFRVVVVSSLAAGLHYTWRASHRLIPGAEPPSGGAR
jgi:phosphatidylglycerophosphate synthase